MITVLREVGTNMRHGVIQKADFKIVYVAPMKVRVGGSVGRCDLGRMRTCACTRGGWGMGRRGAVSGHLRNAADATARE